MTYLLLDRGDRDDTRVRVSRLREPARCLERGVGAEAVVERTRHDPAVRQLERLAVPDPDVAGSDALTRILATRGADVDMQVVAAQTAALRAFAPRPRPDADDSFDRPAPPRDQDPLPGELLRVDTAEGAEAERPSPSMCVIEIPISSMWPITASVGPEPGPTRAKEVPSVSPCTAANAAAASRQTRAAGSSAPEGPTAVRRSWSSSGIATACGLNQERLSWGRESLPVHELVVLARERGGSVRLRKHDSLPRSTEKTPGGSFLLP